MELLRLLGAVLRLSVSVKRVKDGDKSAIEMAVVAAIWIVACVVIVVAAVGCREYIYTGVRCYPERGGCPPPFVCGVDRDFPEFGNRCVYPDQLYDSKGDAGPWGGMEVEWARQFGSSDHEWADGIGVARDGTVYVAGTMKVSLDGDAGQRWQGWLTKFLPDGGRLWTVEFGTPEDDFVRGVAVSSSGFVYVAGETLGSFDGGPSGPTVQTAFVRKFDADGGALWTRQFGEGGTYVGAIAVSPDRYSASPDPYIYLGGYVVGNFEGETSFGSSDGYVIKINADGDKVWSRLIGGSEADRVTSISVWSNDVNKIIVGGMTSGVLFDAGVQGDKNGFVMQMEMFPGPEPTINWVRTCGGTGGDDDVLGIADYGGTTVFAGGGVGGNIAPATGQPEADGLICTYGIGGAPAGTRTFASPASDRVRVMTMAGPGLDQIVFAGTTNGSIDGVATNAGYDDIFVGAFDYLGNVSALRQFGTSEGDSVTGIAGSMVGTDFYIVGTTYGAWPGQTALGGADAFLIKVSGRSVQQVP